MSVQDLAELGNRSLDELLTALRGRKYKSQAERQNFIFLLLLTVEDPKEQSLLLTMALDRLLGDPPQ